MAAINKPTTKANPEGIFEAPEALVSYFKLAVGDSVLLGLAELLPAEEAVLVEFTVTTGVAVPVLQETLGVDVGVAWSVPTWLAVVVKAVEEG